MAFLDDLTNKISQTSQGVVQKTKDTAEIVKINGLISDEEKLMSSVYDQIGKSFYEAHKNDDAPEFAALIGRITECKEKIADYQEQVRRLKGVIDCPHCGKEISYGVPFCSFCGNRIVTETAEAGGAVCTGCGAVLPEGVAFCTNCGTPTAPAAEAVAEETPIEEVAAEETAAPELPTCAVCGAVLSEGVAFCTNCGAKVEAPAPVAEPVVPAEPAPVVSEPVAPVQPEPAPQPAAEPVGKRCAACGAVLAEGVAFCTNCGTKVEVPAPAPVVPEPVAPAEPAPVVSEPVAPVQPEPAPQPAPAPAPAGKKCANCGAVLSEDTLFCTNCGTKVETPAPAQAKKAHFCVNCGTEYEEGSLFCTGCGAKLGEAAAPVKKVCVNCGRELGDDDRFCVGCGTRV